MLRRVAKDIAHTASNIIGHYIVITDENGYIIGTSMDREERLETLHEGSLEVLKTHDMVVHTEEMCEGLEGTLPGVTLPIFLGEKIVGTIGIQGISDEVNQFGMLVTIIAEVMLRDRIEVESRMVRHQNRQMLMDMLLTFNPEVQSSEYVENYAKLLGYDTEGQRRTVLISIDTKEEQSSTKGNTVDPYKKPSYEIIAKYFEVSRDVVVAQGINTFIVLAEGDSKGTWDKLKSKLEAMQVELTKVCGETYIGVGSVCNETKDVKVSYKRAQDAIEIAMKNGPSPVMIEDIPVERIIIELSSQMDDEFWIENLGGFDGSDDKLDVLKTIVVWCENGFNFAKTAEDIGVHRNTLNYRFKRMKDQYNIDLYDYKKCIALYLSARAVLLNNSR